MSDSMMAPAKMLPKSRRSSVIGFAISSITMMGEEGLVRLEVVA